MKLKGKDLKLGGTYLTKDNVQLVYLGRFDEWDYEYIYEDVRGSYGSYQRKWTGEKEYKIKRKSYYFANPESKSISTIQSLSKEIIGIISEDCVDNYADLMDSLEHDSRYSPVDDSKDEYVNYTLEELNEKAKKSWWNIKFFVDKDEQKEIHYVVRHDYSKGMYETSEENLITLEEVYKKYQPKYLRKYLQNGKIYSEGK